MIRPITYQTNTQNQPTFKGGELNRFQKFIANKKLYSIGQNTAYALLIETGLKAIGRPSFILIDKDIKPETKKYAAVKELIYQGTCLLIYAALVMPVFKAGAFKIAKAHLEKTEPLIKNFKKASEFLDYHSKSLDDKSMKQFPKLKGAMELGNTVGSVLGLAILAPQVSHVTIHPILQFLGLEKKHDGEQKH